MRTSLWPESAVEEQESELDAYFREDRTSALPSAILVAEDSGGLSGFLEVSLRSHADGCDVTRPVGYVEGWFVREAVRHSGVGRALMGAAEAWARGHGCREMASDALIDNELSQQAHQGLGFAEVDRCVHYRKDLGTG